MAEEIITREADVLVVGGGLAGCFAAIKAREAGARKVIQLDKCQVGKSGCSAFAAGIMTAFCPEEDDLDYCLKTAVEGADYLVDQEQLQDHFAQIWDQIKEMESLGVEFEKTPEGKLYRYPGRGFIPNVMFHGPQMMDAMRKATRKKGVEQLDKTMMTDLLTRNERVVGALAFNILSGEWVAFQARATVLATGFNWYKGRQPGHRNVTGDGYMAALRAGAVLHSFDGSGGNLFPVRYDIGPGMHMYQGTGIHFLNSDGERFMERYDPVHKERAHLPVLYPSFCSEAQRGRVPIQGDMRHFTSEQVQRLKRVIPLPMLMYSRVGIVEGDRFVKLIEWGPTAPICNGGVKVNRKMESTVSGLYACGDALTWEGAEGGGQAALVGAATTGARAGLAAAEYARGEEESKIDPGQVRELRDYALAPLRRAEGIEPDQVLLAAQEAVVPYKVLQFRREGRLNRALEEIQGILAHQAPLLKAYDLHYLRMALEARNIASLAEIQLRSSLFRKESRGRGLREDYPLVDNVNWLKRVMVKKEGGELKLWAEEIPIHRYPLKPVMNKTLHPWWQSLERLGYIRLKEGEVEWV